MQVRLNGLLFDGTEDPGAKFTVELDGVKGLFGGVGVRADTVARSLSDGDFSLPVFRDARVLWLRGLIFSDGLVEQQEDMSRLGAVLAAGERAVLSVDAAIGVRWCRVELGDEPDIEVLVPGKVARYQLVLRARDPRLFSERRTVTGVSVKAVNYGTFPASPVVSVAGPVAAPYTVVGPGGRTFQVTQSLTGSQSHSIDFRSGRVSRNGVLQVGAVGRAELWTIPPGGTVLMSISDGVMSVQVDDTYM